MKAEITVTATGGAGSSIVIDGRDVTHITRAFCLESGVHEITRLELDLVATKGATVVADAVVELGEDVTAFLVHLGWTPPNVAVESSVDSGDRQPNPPG